MPLDANQFSRMMMGLLLYRLGGQQSFTMEEMNAIGHLVHGVQIAITDDDRVVVTTRSPHQVKGKDTI